jgi:hypothetical protein
MLETVLALLVSLGLAAGGVQGVTTAQDHQATAGPAGASDEIASELASQGSPPSFTDLLAMITDKVMAAAEHADEHAQDALTAASTAAANGLETAASASSAHGADAAANAADAAGDAGPPSDLPGPGDHPGR